MPKYFDSDELLKKLPDDLPYKASVKRVLIQAPAADVVPKSEVAREIIAEFKEMAKSRLLECGLYLAVFKNTLAYVEEELKKKYTEEKV